MVSWNQHGPARPPSPLLFVRHLEDDPHDTMIEMFHEDGISCGVSTLYGLTFLKGLVLCYVCICPSTSTIILPASRTPLHHIVEYLGKQIAVRVEPSHYDLNYIEIGAWGPEIRGGRSGRFNYSPNISHIENLRLILSTTHHVVLSGETVHFKNTRGI